MRSVGLDGFFTLGGFGDEPGEKWDAARRGVALAQACYSAAFSTDQIYLVGDGTYDITTAKRLGIKCVAVGSGWVPGEELKKRNPDFYFDDLHRVDEVLKVLLNGIE